MELASGFRTALDFEDANGYPFTLTKPLQYYSARLNTLICVPRGFQTDLGSIPWLAQPLFGFLRVGRYDRATVIHDWLYATQMHPRHVCDAVLLEAARTDHVDWRGNLIWAGVRIGGWWAWHSDKSKIMDMWPLLVALPPLVAPILQDPLLGSILHVPKGP